MTATQDVLFSVKKGKEQSIGLITLNRPEVLNSLNHDMIHAMSAQLHHWARDDDIKAVVIQAAPGRAFCAGGDLRLTYERAKANDALMNVFFQDEYQLNKLIHHFKKPYIAFLNGITMGGGASVYRCMARIVSVLKNYYLRCLKQVLVFFLMSGVRIFYRVLQMRWVLI